MFRWVYSFLQSSSWEIHTICIGSPAQAPEELPCHCLHNYKEHKQPRLSTVWDPPHTGKPAVLTPSIFQRGLLTWRLSIEGPFLMLTSSPNGSTRSSTYWRSVEVNQHQSLLLACYQDTMFLIVPSKKGLGIWSSLARPQPWKMHWQTARLSYLIGISATQWNNLFPHGHWR